MSIFIPPTFAASRGMSVGSFFHFEPDAMSHIDAVDGSSTGT
jgi:hypothetical protein